MAAAVSGRAAAVGTSAYWFLVWLAASTSLADALSLFVTKGVAREMERSIKLLFKPVFTSLCSVPSTWKRGDD